MAKYTYKETEESSNDALWIAKLQRINPVSLASSHHTEIYFTQPKEAQVQAVQRPHVTFVSSSSTTHWYLRTRAANTASSVTIPASPRTRTKRPSRRT